MGRAKSKPVPEAVILPPDLDDDEEHTGGGVPDDDGWVWLKDGTKRRREPDGEGEKPKRRRASRRNR